MTTRMNELSPSVCANTITKLSKIYRSGELNQFSDPRAHKRSPRRKTLQKHDPHLACETRLGEAESE